MWHQDFISFDTETTGFRSDSRIVELAAIRWVGGEVREVFDTRFDPGAIDWEGEAVKQAQAVHHITREMLAGCPTFESHVDQLARFLQASPLLVAHNVAFDLRMLDQEFDRAGRRVDLPDAICTMKLARSLRPGGHKLHESCEMWGVGLPARDHHTAFGDARACGLLLLAMHARGELPDRL